MKTRQKKKKIKKKSQKKNKNTQQMSIATAGKLLAQLGPFKFN